MRYRGGWGCERSGGGGQGFQKRGVRVAWRRTLDGSSISSGSSGDTSTHDVSEDDGGGRWGMVVN